MCICKNCNFSVQIYQVTFYIKYLYVFYAQTIVLSYLELLFLKSLQIQQLADSTIELGESKYQSKPK